MNPTLIKAYTAGGAVAKHRLVTWHTGDREIVQAAAADDELVGVADRLGAASGERIEIVRAGIALVEYGAAVTRGDLLTADADGKAITADPETVFQLATAGAAADADIVATGLKPGDALISVIELADGYADRTANASIHAADTIRITDATAGDRLLVTWRRRTRTIGVAEISGVAGDHGEVLISPGLL